MSCKFSFERPNGRKLLSDCRRIPDASVKNRGVTIPVITNLVHFVSSFPIEIFKCAVDVHGGWMSKWLCRIDYSWWNCSIESFAQFTSWSLQTILNSLPIDCTRFLFWFEGTVRKVRHIQFSLKFCNAVALNKNRMTRNDSPAPL